MRTFFRYTGYWGHHNKVVFNYMSSRTVYVCIDLCLFLLWFSLYPFQASSQSLVLLMLRNEFCRAKKCQEGDSLVFLVQKLELMKNKMLGISRDGEGEVAVFFPWTGKWMEVRRPHGQWDPGLAL